MGEVTDLITAIQVVFLRSEGIECMVRVRALISQQHKSLTDHY